MKRRLPAVAVSLLILMGLALLLYPTISNWLAQQDSVSMTQAYNEEVRGMSEAEMENELAAARKYNDALSGANIEDPFMPDSGTVLPENYTSILDFGNGMMGYIEIPQIEVFLPIYHGTDENVLRKGVGHMQSTAFPVGGEGNHTVLTGHTGLPSAKLFTDLDQLEIGSVFYITILKETYAYEIDQIVVVEPDDTESLRPTEGEDYISLVTCTPYGINSHRLLVRGTRIPYQKEAKENLTTKSADAVNRQLLIVLALVIFLVVVFFIRRYIRSRKKRK